MAPSPRGARLRVTAADKRRLLAEGPIGWRNWRALEIGTRRGPEGFEVALYSDCRFVDELRGLGPYTVFNTVPFDDPVTGVMSVALVLRVAEYGHAYIDITPPMDEPTVGTYHGGWLADEIAALVSLAGGFRLEAGEMTRRFRGMADPGVPTQWYGRPPSPVVAQVRRPMLPNVARRADIGGVRELLESYPRLPSGAATALVRAARQYQRALLIADLDPGIAWLQLVSAVEVAAAYHVRDAGTDRQVLAAGWPALAEQMRGLRPKRQDALAALLAPQIRAGARYRRFLKDFHAPAPLARTEVESARVKWTKSSISTAAQKIYEHRSVALHEGVPFPSPLCEPPLRSDNGEYDERPFAGGVGSFDAFWAPTDLPMYLHVYAYIVAHTLKSWWTALATRSA